MITAVDFGPCLLQDEYPYFILICPAKGPLLLVRIKWKQVINYYLSFNSINPHCHCVTSLSIYLLGKKDFTDAMLFFSEWAETRQKVTIATMPLLYVIRCYIVEYLVIAFAIDLTWPLPFKVIPHLNSLLSLNHGVNDWITVCFEIRICKKYWWVYWIFQINLLIVSILFNDSSPINQWQSVCHMCKLIGKFLFFFYWLYEGFFCCFFTKQRL